MTTRHKLTLKSLKPRQIEHVTNPPANIDPALWSHAHAMWAEIRWRVLDSEWIVKILIPLIAKAWRVDALEAELATVKAELVSVKQLLPKPRVPRKAVKGGAA